MAIYVYHKNVFSPEEDQQWVQIMVQNDNLTPDTQRSVTFQLTSVAAIRKDANSDINVRITKKEMKSIIHAVNTASGSTDIEEIKKLLAEIKPKIEGAKK